MNTKNTKKLRLHQKKFVESLIFETEQNVAAMLSKMTDDNTLVEDVMIATWSLVCRKVEILENHENPHGWIMNAAKFKMFKALEKKRRLEEKEMLVLDKLENYLAVETEMKVEMSETLKPYLSESERSALILKYYYDVSYTELAEHFHVSEAAMRKRISRSLKKLRKAFKEPWYK